MPSKDPLADLGDFLTNFHLSKSGQPSSLYQEPAATPRYAPCLTVTEEASLAHRSRSRNWRTRAGSSGSSGGSSGSSTATTTGRSTVFDARTTKTASSVSTAPSRNGRIRERRPAIELPPLPHAVLVCEFIGYTFCDAVFDPADLDGWIAHVAANHLDHRFPRQSMCWFCPEVFAAATRKHRHREQAFARRMEHIAGHFARGETVEDMRPDFYFLDHLRAWRLIDEDTFHRAKDYHELPPAAQMDDLHPAGSLPRVQEEPCWHEGPCCEEAAQPGERYRVRGNGSIVYL